MAFTPKNDTGALFRNDKRENDQQPEYRGDGLVNGEPVWLSAWIKESKDDRKYFSIAFKNKTEKAAHGPRASLKSELNDEIPFAPEWRG
jgi:hypothetical protein